MEVENSTMMDLMEVAIPEVIVQDPVVAEAVIQVLVYPAEAAVQLQEHFRFEAKRLRKKDWFTQDDLVQEMSLAVLEHPEPMPLCFFKETARNRAIDYLIEWKRKSRVPYGTPSAMRFTDPVFEKSDMEREEEERENQSRQRECNVMASLFKRPGSVKRVTA
jgi:DNA-directed RNA polymerase specialized sigma24 family protein